MGKRHWGQRLDGSKNQVPLVSSHSLLTIVKSGAEEIYIEVSIYRWKLGLQGWICLINIVKHFIKTKKDKLGWHYEMKAEEEWNLSVWVMSVGVWISPWHSFILGWNQELKDDLWNVPWVIHVHPRIFCTRITRGWLLTPYSQVRQRVIRLCGRVQGK